MMLTTTNDLPWLSLSKVSTKDKAEVERLARQINTLAGRIRKEFLESLDNLYEKIDLKKLKRLLIEGRVGEAIEILNTEAILEGLRPIGSSVTDASIAAGRAAAVQIKTPTEARYVFGVTNPQTVEHLRRYEFKLVRELTVEARGAIRTTITEGMSAGRNPLTIARDVKQNIRLTQQQARYVANYRRNLETLDRRALQRTLRDKRFDRALDRAISGESPLPQAKIDKMVEAYQKKWLKYRSEMISRTEATRANNFGNRETWRQAVEDGTIPANSVRRFWIYTRDRLTREAHKAIPKMNPDGVGIEEAFKSPLGPIMYPGDPEATAENVIHCRCTVFMKYVRQ